MYFIKNFVHRNDFFVNQFLIILIKIEIINFIKRDYKQELILKISWA